MPNTFTGYIYSDEYILSSTIIPEITNIDIYSDYGLFGKKDPYKKKREGIILNLAANENPIYLAEISHDFVSSNQTSETKFKNIHKEVVV